MKKLLTIEWKIYDTREENGAYRTGVSKIELKARGYKEVLNAAISFADEIPSWELERNNIDIEDYREKPYCCYHYGTKLTRILKIENLK